MSANLTYFCWCVWLISTDIFNDSIQPCLFSEWSSAVSTSSLLLIWQSKAPDLLHQSSPIFSIHLSSSPLHLRCCPSDIRISPGLTQRNLIILGLSFAQELTTMLILRHQGLSWALFWENLVLWVKNHNNSCQFIEQKQYVALPG